MWWCCGKVNKEAQGCKYSKHISKEDQEDQEDLDKEIFGEKLTTKNLRCAVLVYY